MTRHLDDLDRTSGPQDETGPYHRAGLRDEAAETSPRPDIQQERNWAMLCHLSAFLGAVGIPFGNILGPLGVWLWKRTEYPMVEEHGKESLNFQISMTVYMIVAGILVFVLIGIPILALLILADIMFTVIAAVKASSGESYRYPLTIRMVR